jgi:cytochrome c
MKRSLMLLLVLASAASSSAYAQADLAKSKNCMACHAVGSKLMKGGAGVWGPVPMPANPQVSDAEAHALVKWVLAQK